MTTHEAHPVPGPWSWSRWLARLCTGIPVLVLVGGIYTTVIQHQDSQDATLQSLTARMLAVETAMNNHDIPHRVGDLEKENTAMQAQYTTLQQQGAALSGKLDDFQQQLIQELTHMQDQIAFLIQQTSPNTIMPPAAQAQVGRGHK